MTGAECMVQAAADCGVDVCFANPGTTEMGIVNALDRVDGMRAVLGLFEGVCTGAADGYARMTGRPALTLLHLGPGFANGVANLHNARRAASPVVNLIGNHPQHHLPYNSPLTADLEGLVRTVSHWHHVSSSAEGLISDIAEAISASMSPPGQIASLIVPTDVAATSVDVDTKVSPGPYPTPLRIPDEAVTKAITALKSGEPAALLLGDRALHERSLRAAGRVAKSTGCRLLSGTFPARWERGAGLSVVERIPYFPEAVLNTLKGIKHLIVIGAKVPVSFFYYEGIPSELLPEGCTAQVLARPEDDVVGVLDVLADEIGAADRDVDVATLMRPDAPTGEIDAGNVGQSLASLMPAGAALVDEGATAGYPSFVATQFAQPHSMLFLSGGSIGFGLPAATGAAIACPDRKVIVLQADGSGMYTVQALWTQAREGLDVTTILLSNRRYNILQIEMHRMGMDSPGSKAMGLTDLSNPDLNWCQLAQGMGVPATRPESAEAFHHDLERAIEEPGPHLIEVKV